MPKFLPIILLLAFCQKAVAQAPAFHFPANYLTYYITEKPDFQLIEGLVYWKGAVNLDSAIAHKADFKEFSNQTFPPGQKVWFSITLFNSLPKLHDWVLHFGQMEEAEVHLVYENGIYQNFKLPSKLPNDLPEGSFEIAIPADEAVNVYFLASSAKPKIQLETPEHWQIREKARMATRQTYIFLAVAGLVILAMVFVKVRKLKA
mgnify:CR=1 FL=1